MMTPQLSVCVIVKNEAERLPLLLKDVSQFADEIIVVDTGSSDDSVAIAESFGAKVYSFSWCDDFSAARNASLDKANGKWILWLDADDRVGKTEGSQITSLVGTSSLTNAYTVEIINTSADGRPSSFLQLRLFPNDKRLRFEGRIHESVAAAAKRYKFDVSHSGIKIIHTGYETETARKSKMERNLSLLLRELEKDPANIAHRFLLAGSLAFDGKIEESIRQYEIICNTKDAFEKQADVLVRSLVALARWYNQSGRYSVGEQWAKKAVALRDTDMEAQYELARAQAGRGDLFAAHSSARKGMACEPYLSSVVIDFISVRAALYELMMHLLHHSQKHLEAGEWLRKGLEELPYSPEMVTVAAQYYLSIKRSDLATNVYRQAISRMPELRTNFESAISTISENINTKMPFLIHPEFLRTLPADKFDNVLVCGKVNSDLINALTGRGASRIDGVGGGELCRKEFDSYYDVLKSDVRYDVVIVGNGVENMQSPIEELKLLSQVMTPDGKAFFSFSNLQFYSVFTSIAYGLYGAGIAVNGRAGSSGSGRMYTRDYAVSLLEKASFRVTTIVELLDPMYQQQIVKESAKSMSLGKMVLDLEGLDAEQAKPFFAVTYFVHAVNNNTVNAITKDMKLAVAPSTVKAKSIEDDGRKLLDCGDYKGAALKFLELIEILPDNADGYTLLGLSEWYKGNIDDAYFLFKHALSITPDDCDALLNFWDAALKTNKVSEAKKILEDALARNPAFTELRDALAKKN